ncbi:hypothetical protein J1614_008333 [Plenodomus biglobosus]|nr:hypothetical protein J1614_008333 [Plenodomus biglobosus]
MQCLFFCVPALSIYAAAKYASMDLLGAIGKLLEDGSLAVNAVAPHALRTAVNSDVLYGKSEAEGILTPMDGLMNAFWTYYVLNRID